MLQCHQQPPSRSKLTCFVTAAHHDDFNNFGNYADIDDVVHNANDRLKQNVDALPLCFNSDIGSNTPIWMRNYSSPPNQEPRKKESSQKMLEDALGTVGADRLVMGHTVQKQINSALGGRAWRIDVGASKGVEGGTPEVLEVRKQGDDEIVSVLTPTGAKTDRDRQTFSFLW